MRNPQITFDHDKHRRPVAVGDLLKIYHFTAARAGLRRYMYKLVADVPGQGIRAIDITEIATKGIEAAHSCPLSFLGDFEIIDGPSIETPEGYLICWWERKRKPKTDQAAA